MTNKDAIINLLKNEGLKLGCYDNGVDKISKKEFKRVLDNFFFDSGDIEIKIRNKDYILETYRVDNEVDFMLLTKKEYENRYFC